MKKETYYCDICKQEQDPVMLRKVSFRLYEEICRSCRVLVHKLREEIYEQLSAETGHDLKNVAHVSRILRNTKEEEARRIWGTEGLKQINIFKASYPTNKET